MNYVYRQPFNYAAHRAAAVYWQPQPLWQFEGVSDAWSLYEGDGNAAVVAPEPVADAALDVAGAPARRAIQHPGWQRKQAEDQLRFDRELERTITRALRGDPEEPVYIAPPPQKTAAQIAAAMAAEASARSARQRATELAMEAQRARVAIAQLQPELNERRKAASYRVIEQLLREF